MNEFKLIEIYCPLVNGSQMPFYDISKDKLEEDDDFFDNFIDFISTLDFSKSGKIDIGENTKDLVEYLLGGDDFGAPPISLVIKFSHNGISHELSIPYANSTYIIVYS